LGMNLPRRFQDRASIRWLGHLPRSEVMRHYRDADVLVFPSLSDGFGMAQVEAQGWALPIIASPFCGSVVRDGVNGIVLSEVSPGAVAAALGKVANDPELLAKFASNSRCSDEFGVQRLACDLLRLKPE
jgi:glycosyltransferase involved in cell wall biosynthesis